MSLRIGGHLADVLAEKRERADARALSARSGGPQPHTTTTCLVGGVAQSRRRAGLRGVQRVTCSRTLLTPTGDGRAGRALPFQT